MAITSDDVKLYESQRLTDTDDGGGRATGNVVIDGAVNNLFPDISRLDRTIGDVALRKAFVGIDTANADVYLGAHAILTDAPDDPRVSAVLFHAESEADERSGARNRIESYVVRGAQAGWFLLGNQYAGQRLLIAFQDQVQDQPEPGEVYELISASGDSQFIRITDVEAAIETFIHATGGTAQYLERRKLTLGISAPLEHYFDGGAPTPGGSSSPKSAVQTTEVADAAKYYGITTLAEDADQGSLALQIDSLFAALVPSAQSETVWADQPGGYVRALVVAAEDGTRTETGNALWDPSATFYSRRPIVPGSLNLSIYGGLYTDDEAGNISYVSGTPRFVGGSVDYVNGVIEIWDDPGNQGSASWSLTYQAGAPLTGKAESGAIEVTAQNRAFSYTLNLADAKPRPQTLVIHYRAQGKWQAMTDIGGGELTGAGSGSVNYATGTAVATFPVQPDAGTYIVYAWIANVATEFDTHEGTTSISTELIIGCAPGLAPGSVDLSWTSDGAKTASDDGAGAITGDASGTVNYSSGVVTLRPDAVIDSGTSITVDYDSATSGTELEAESLSPDGNGSASGTIAGAPLMPASVSFTFNVTRITTHSRSTLSSDTTWELDALKEKVLIDDGAGGFTDLEGNTVAGSIDYTTGAWTLTVEDQYTYPRVVGSFTGAWGYGTKAITDDQVLQEDYTGVCNIRYQGASASQTLGQTVYDASELVLPLPASAGPIIPRSLEFSFGGEVHVDIDGLIYRDPAYLTGLGTAVGSVDYAAHRVVLDSWPDGAAATVDVTAMATQARALTSSVMLFRVPGSPLRPGSVQITATRADTSALITATADVDGTLTAAGELSGHVDVETGLVRLWFTSNDADETGASDIPIFPSSLRYNAVSYTFLPLDADLIGIDPVRLPADGKVPIFRDGDVLVLAHTATTDAGTPTAGQVVNLARDHQAEIVVVDADGVALDPAQYTVDLALGRVTFANPLTLEDVDANALTTPLAIEDRIEHMTVVSDAQISGDLAMIAPTAHDYPAGSRVSSALLWGDIQARALNEFTQKTWNSSTPNWTDARSGDDTTASYNLIDHPVLVDNNGAITEKWALVFTSSSAFQIVGEQVGIIGTGSTGGDTAPTNPNTGNAYFVVEDDGWGTGWVAGNVLRFDTAGCLAPLWLARTVVSGQGTVDDDSVTIQIRGDAD